LVGQSVYGPEVNRVQILVFIQDQMLKIEQTHECVDCDIRHALPDDLAS
jgi:hypothetical protein